MADDPNDIWKIFDLFVRDRFEHVPPQFKYLDLKKYPLEKHENIIGETLDIMAKNEQRANFNKLWKGWKDFLEAMRFLEKSISDDSDKPRKNDD